MDTLGTIAVGLLIVAALIRQRNSDRKQLRQFVASVVKDGNRGKAAVSQLAARIFELPEATDPIWACRLFKAFGASPGAIIKGGACCSGKTRLLILSLAELDIRAYQITLYHEEGQAQHCLAEVHLDNECLLVDPSYGIYLTGSEGCGVSIRALQQGVQPLQVSFTATAKCGYPKDRYYRFDYRASKTANWTCSAPRRAAYSILYRVSRGAVDHMLVPAWFEWPQNLGIVACMMMFLSFAALGSV